MRTLALARASTSRPTPLTQTLSSTVLIDHAPYCTLHPVLSASSMCNYRMPDRAALANKYSVYDENGGVMYHCCCTPCLLAQELKHIEDSSRGGAPAVGVASTNPIRRGSGGGGGGGDGGGDANGVAKMGGV